MTTTTRPILDYRKNPIAVGDTIKNIESGWRGTIQEVANEDDADPLNVMLICLGVNWWTGELDLDDKQWHSPFDVIKQPRQAPQPGEAPSTTNFL